MTASSEGICWSFAGYPRMLAASALNPRGRNCVSRSTTPTRDGLTGFCLMMGRFVPQLIPEGPEPSGGKKKTLCVGHSAEGYAIVRLSTTKVCQMSDFSHVGVSAEVARAS